MQCCLPGFYQGAHPVLLEISYCGRCLQTCFLDWHRFPVHTAPFLFLEDTMTEHNGSQSLSEHAATPVEAGAPAEQTPAPKKSSETKAKPAKAASRRGRPSAKTSKPDTPADATPSSAPSAENAEPEKTPARKAPSAAKKPKTASARGRAQSAKKTETLPDALLETVVAPSTDASAETREESKGKNRQAPASKKSPRTPAEKADSAEKAEPAEQATAKTASKGKPAKSSGRRGRPKAVKEPAVPAETADAPVQDVAPFGASPAEVAPAQPDAPAGQAVEVGQTADQTDSKPEAKAGRRGRGGSRSTSRGKKSSPKTKTDTVAQEIQEQDEFVEETAVAGDEAAEKGKKPSRRRGARSKKSAAEGVAAQQEAIAEDSAEASESEDAAPEGETVDSAEQAVEEGKGKQGKKTAPAPKLRRKMFVSVHPEEQIEVVLTEEGVVQEYYVEMLQQAKTKGNIYKAVIHNIDSNLQAAFVNYGPQKNGFLQIDEVHPEYFNTSYEATKGRKYPPIQKVLKQGQELLVQVVKEPTGTKGAFLTTYLSLPGRFLVLTPGREQIGVSRKVDDDGERSRLRELLNGLTPGPGLGVIVRTASMGTSKTTLQKDLQDLKKTWKEVRTRGTEQESPSLIYQEMDLTTRAVRDYLTEQVCEVWLDDEATAKSVEDLAKRLFPQKKKLVSQHKDTGTTLFERFNLQRQLDQIHSREVALPSGGRLVIDPTEALTAIDINSGRSGGKTNFEDMAYRTNLEAAKMIPLQLRLRDIGGQVVADFIEMRDKNHWREVEKTLRNGMKIDRARYDIGKVGPFGMLEMVRQRLGSSAISVSMEVCPLCKGTGIRRNTEWQSQQALKDILRKMRAAQAQKQVELVYEIDPHVAIHLLNNKRQRLVEMEQQTGVRLEIRPVVQ